VALNQALCLVRGEPWLGIEVPKRLRVGIVQQEIPEGALKERLQKILRVEQQYDVDVLDSIPHCTRQGLKLDTKEGIEFLRSWLDKAKIDVLQLDPLYTFHTGDENNPRDMGRIFSSLREIVRDYRLAIEVIHHHGKPSQVEREGGDLHRGTSLLRDVTDANWTFTKVPANKLALNEPPSHYVFLNFEQRHCAAPDPFLLHLNKETLWFDIVQAQAVREAKVEEIIEELVARGGKCLQDDLKQALEKKLGVGDRSIRDAIYAARDKGLIEPGFRTKKRLWTLAGNHVSEPRQADGGDIDPEIGCQDVSP
jgi:hypothetical protein